MPEIALRGLDGGTVSIDEPGQQALQAALRVPLLRPGDAAFDAACLIWNGMIKDRPALIAQPCGNADVVACINFARTRNVLLSVKGGGHNVAGTALADGALLLDMSRMKGVHVDRPARTVRAQGGCLLGDIDRETALFGLAAVLGFVSETGVAGLTLGGGFGYLTRQYGWTVDNLLEVEICTADGQVRRASADENPDLFWALCGGGGNFGIATSFLLKLYDMPARITGGLAIFDAERADAVLAAFKEMTGKGSRKLTCALTMRRAPPAPFLPKQFHGKPVIGVVACHTGSLAEARADLAPIKSLDQPLADLIVEKTYVEQQRMLDATQPKGMHYYWKSEYVPGLSDGLFAVAKARAAAITSPMSQFILFHLGGALDQRAADDGAVGNRDAAFVCNIAGAWPPTQPDADAQKAWVRDTWQAVRPFSTGGAYVNFQSADEGEDRVRDAYGANLDHLLTIKAKYDPTNLFRVNRNLTPPRTKAG